MPIPPDPQIARQRVTSYQARIERTLTDIFFDVPMTHAIRCAREIEGTHWTLTAAGHTTGYAQCELCGHTPIRRLFFITPVQGNVAQTERTLMIGSECALNYADVDLVQGYMRRIEREQNRSRDNARREEQAAATRARIERQAEENRQRTLTWRDENQDIIEWLNVREHLINRRNPTQRSAATGEVTPNYDHWLESMSDRVCVEMRALSDHVTNLIRNNMAEYEQWRLEQMVDVLQPEQPLFVYEHRDDAADPESAAAIAAIHDRWIEANRASASPTQETDEEAEAQALADSTPATADDAIHIYNGTYSYERRDNETLWYQIYTVRNGPLAGQRVIKTRLGANEWKGFAFLTRSGHARLWRAYQNHTGPYVALVHHFLQGAAAMDNVMVVSRPLPSHGANVLATVSRATTTCRICNQPLRDANFDAGVHLTRCAHDSTTPRRPATSALTTTRQFDVAAMTINHRRTRSWANRPSQQLTLPDPSALPQLARDELGMGEVL